MSWASAKPMPEFFEQGARADGRPRPGRCGVRGRSGRQRRRPGGAAGMRAVWLRRGPWGVIHRDASGRRRPSWSTLWTSSSNGSTRSGREADRRRAARLPTRSSRATRRRATWSKPTARPSFSTSGRARCGARWPRRPGHARAVVVSHLHPDHLVDLVPMRHYLRYAQDERRRSRSMRPPSCADESTRSLARTTSWRACRATILGRQPVGRSTDRSRRSR